MLLDVQRALSIPDVVAPVLLKQGAPALEFSTHLAWSPDGTRLAVSFWPHSVPGTTGGVIQLLDVADALVEAGRCPGSGAGCASPLDPDRAGSDPRFSPDGTRLLYVGQDPAGVPALFVDDLRVGWRVTLGVTAGESASPDSYWTYNGYAWSPDGKFVAYLRVGPWLGAWPASVLSRDSRAQIILAEPEGSQHPVVMDLAPAPNGILGLDYSPDGRVLSFIASEGYSGCWSIHLLSLDDQALHRLPGVCHAMRTALPSWSPDGRWLAFTAGWDAERPAPDGSGALELTALDVFQYFFALDEAQRALPVRLSTWVGDDLSPAWQPVCHSGIPNC
jgi:Tol biopolymer transport system component